MQAADFAGNLSSLYQINSFGHKRIVLLGISYNQAAGSSTKNIALRSDLLRVQKGFYPYFLFTTQQSSFVISTGQSDIAFDSNINGNLDITFVDLATNVFPTNFVSCILYLDIQDIPNPPLLEQHYKHHHKK
jgi:hypothetical protein